MTNSNKSALITGASKGIGAAIAIQLAYDGFDIYLNYRSDHDAAKEILEQVKGLGVNCILCPFDVTDYEATEIGLEPLLEAPPFAVINNAGFAKDTLFGLMDKNSWHNVLDVHLNGFYNVTRMLIPLMMRKRKGRIVNIVSTAGQTGNAGQVNYSAAKAGLIGATKSLAMEIAKRNILVNAVSPGFIETEMTSQLPIEQIKKLIPLGKLGKPEDVANMVSFLCSDKAEYITGQTFSINGGIFTT
ncbi:MAG: 3-oxoacyl-ACP reductase FabG [Desulfotalea sp.]